MVLCRFLQAKSPPPTSPTYCDICTGELVDAIHMFQKIWSMSVMVLKKVRGRGWRIALSLFLLPRPLLLTLLFAVTKR